MAKVDEVTKVGATHVPLGARPLGPHAKFVLRQREFVTTVLWLCGA